LNVEIYNNMMNNEPEIDSDYLHKALGLEKDKQISDVVVSEVTESNTALTIKFSVQIEGGANEKHQRSFFVKTIKKDSEITGYHELCLNEVNFYKLIREGSNIGLPIPKCIDAYISEDGSKFLLLLDDISDSYNPPNETILLNEQNWVKAARSLASFHARFWDTDEIGSNDLPIEDAEKTQSYIDDIYDGYSKFKEYVGDHFDGKTIAIYEHAVKIAIELVNERYERMLNRDNVTVMHGDAHIHNFMFPEDCSKDPIIVDFQFWGLGIGLGDIAHLTRVSFPKIYGRNMHFAIVKEYYDTLVAEGVRGYSWERCWNDYRRQVASMLLIPAWQYTLFNREYEQWVDDVTGLISNYDVLECGEL